jgi:hypothetical protein
VLESLPPLGCHRSFPRLFPVEEGSSVWLNHLIVLPLRAHAAKPRFYSGPSVNRQAIEIKVRDGGSRRQKSRFCASNEYWPSI